MASLKDSTQADLSGYTPVTPTTPAPAAAPAVNEQLSRNVMLRCPLPPLSQVSPDSLRQFYAGGIIPQNRLLTPAPPVTNAGNVTENNSIFIAGGGSGGSTTPTTSGQPVLFTNQQIVVTSQLSPGQRYIGSTQISNTFQLLGIFSGTAVRVQLYGSAVAQQADLARPLDVAPPAGTVQGLITDIALDTVPYLWNFENSIAANQEEPQTGTIYITITNIGNTTSIVTATILFVALSLGLSPNAPALSVTPGGVISNLQLANSSQFAFLNTSNQFSGTISAPVVSVNSAAGLQIGNVQIQSADLSDSTNLSYLDQSNTFTGDINAPVINANSASGLQVAGSQVTSLDLADSSNIAYLNETNTFTGDINAPVLNVSSAAGLKVAGSQVASADLSDSTNIAYLNVTNTFTGTINAPVVDVNSAAGLKVAGSQVSSSTLSDASNIAYLSVSNTFTGTINAPVVDVATSGGFTVAGTQLSSINLLDSGNLATLSGVNVFTNTVTAPTLTITGSAANIFTGPVSAAKITSTGSAANVFTGPVTSAQFTQASGSSSANVFNGSVTAATFTQAAGSTTAVTFNGTVNAATFSGAVSTVNLTCTGGTVNFTGSGLTVTEINTFAPPVESNADKTLNHVITQTAVSGTTFTFTLAQLTSTGVSFTVTSAGTSDVFNVSAEMLYKVSAGTNGGFLVALVDSTIGTQFGFGLDNIEYGSGPGVCVYSGSATGLSAGSHTITLYFASMVLISGAPNIQSAGGVGVVRTQGQCQQISA